MLEEELLGTLQSLCEKGACYFSPSSVDFSDRLPEDAYVDPHYQPHRHWSHAEAIRLIHGEMALYVNGVWSRLADDRMRIFQLGTEHSEHYLRPDVPYTLQWLLILPGCIRIHWTGYSPNGGYHRHQRKSINLGSPVSANLWRCASENSPFRPRLHYLLMESLDSTLKNRNLGIDTENYRTNVLGEIKDYIDEYYWKQLSISDLGAMTHFSPPYLNRLFRERFHVSLHDYMSQMRMERAAEMLRGDPDSPVGKIAAAVGIQDQRYFSRCFRRAFGMTPGDYRAANNAALSDPSK